MSKIKDFLKKTTEYINSNKKAAAIAGIALAAVVAVIIAVICLLSARNDSDSPWGEGITEGIPAFEGEYKSCDSDPNGEYFAIYFENVTTEQVRDYENRLSSDCGIVFQGQVYPRSAVYGDRIIVIHYNVTEMKLSVTVTKKSMG